MEEVFAQARDAESAAEDLLVDEHWRPVQIDPEAVEVNGNGCHADDNGHSDAIGIGPTVELVPDTAHHVNGATNGHVPAPVNEHHDDEATEPQQCLFSWAEFMAAEPAKPKRRRRKPLPTTASLFEWALTLEQEREAELVGTGR